MLNAIGGLIWKYSSWSKTWSFVDVIKFVMVGVTTILLTLLMSILFGVLALSILIKGF